MFSDIGNVFIGELLKAFKHNDERMKIVFDFDKIQLLKIGTDEYENIIRDTMSRILDNFYLKDYPVDVICERKTKTIPLVKLVINMIFMKPFIKYGRKIKMEDIIDVPDECTYNNHLVKYIEMTLTKFKDFFKENIDENLSDIASMIVRDLVRLTNMVSVVTMNSFSLYDAICLAERSPEFNNLIHYHLDESKSVPELQEELENGQNRLVEAIKTDGQSELLPYINTNVYKKMQLAQMFFCIGLRSDSDNKIIPHIVNTNFVNGFGNNIADYYAECEVARFAIIVKDRNIGDSGYLYREFDLLSHSVEIDNSIDDCGTVNTVPFFIKNEFYLNFINNKYIVLDDGKLHIVNYSTDKDLIGKTVRLRSILGCKCKSPYVCKTCYGNQNYNQLESKVGELVSINMISRFSNAAMSAKHATAPDAIEIDDETIQEYFTIEKDQLFIKNGINTTETVLMFDREYVEEILERMKRGGYDDDDDDDDLDGESSHDPIRKIILIDKVYDKSRDIMVNVRKQIHLEDTYLQFSDSIVSNKKNFVLSHNSQYASLELKNISKDTPIFDITYVSKNVSMHIFNIRKNMRESLEGSFEDVASSHINKMAEIVEDAGYRDINVTGTECIYHGLLKDPEDPYTRFDVDVKNPYVKSIKMKQAIHVNSFTDGLAHEDLVSQFKDIGLFTHDTRGINDIRYKVSDIYKINRVEDLVRQEIPGLLERYER